MELAEFLESIGKAENGEALTAFIKGELESLRTESAKHRVGKKKAEEDLANFKKSVEGLEPKGTGAQQVKALQEQLKELEEKVEQANKEREEEKQKRVQADIMAQAVDAFTKGNALDPQEFAKLIIGNVKINEDGSYEYPLEDGKTGSISDGVNSWLTNHAWAVKDSQNAGTGTGGSHPGTKADNNNITLRDAIEKALSN